MSKKQVRKVVKAARTINRPSYKQMNEDLMKDLRLILTQIAAGAVPRKGEPDPVEDEDDDDVIEVEPRRRTEDRPVERERDARGRYHQMTYEDRRNTPRKSYRVISGKPHMYPSTAKVLDYLKDHPDSTRADISSATHMSAGTVKFSLRQLIHMGLVRVDKITD